MNYIKKINKTYSVWYNNRLTEQPALCGKLLIQSGSQKKEGEYNMTGRDSKYDLFASLNWGDLNSWAGSRIVARGRKYQQEGRVSGLARTENGDLVSWVDGSELYATRVTTDDESVLDSVCTCPYGIDCKHGVAVVLEYLKRIKKNTEVPGAEQEDERLEMLNDELWYEDVGKDEDDLPNEDLMKDIEAYLKGKSREQLAELILELHFPDSFYYPASSRWT